MVKSDTTSGQLYMWSAFGQDDLWPLVIHVASHLVRVLTQKRYLVDEEWYYFRSAWTFVSLWVRLTFGQMYPPGEASIGQEWYYFRSA